MLLVLEKTELAADHDGNLAEMCVGEDALMAGLATVLVVGASCSDLDIDGQRRRVGQVAEPGVIGKHWQNGTVVLKDRGLSELRVEKLNLDLVFVADSGTESCGSCGGCGDCCCVLGCLAHQRVSGGG